MCIIFFFNTCLSYIYPLFDIRARARARVGGTKTPSRGVNELGGEGRVAKRRRGLDRRSGSEVARRSPTLSVSRVRNESVNTVARLRCEPVDGEFRAPTGFC